MSSCPVPGKRRRGTNRKGGSREAGNLASGGGSATWLWRGVKGQERIARKRFSSGQVDEAKTSRVRLRARTEEEAKNQ
jgi:hypothetical protein